MQRAMLEHWDKMLYSLASANTEQNVSEEPSLAGKFVGTVVGIGIWYILCTRRLQRQLIRMDKTQLHWLNCREDIRGFSACKVER